MLDRRFVAARTRPLDAHALPQPCAGGPAVRPLPPAARFSLRLRGTPGAVAGFSLEQPINSHSAAGDRWSARLGPDEWLIGGAEADGEVIQAEMDMALDNVAHALVDVSHRNVAFEIAGPDAPVALAAGCPLDLHDSAFPAGTATRTLFGKAEIVLIRPTRERLYRVECWRSFAGYVHGLLIEATHGLGLDGRGLVR